MKRREFITLLGGAAAAWPLVGRAQPAERVRRIAVLMNNAQDDPEGQARAEAFRQGLQALGWIEGRNLRIDWYWTAGDIERTRSNVTELAGRPPDIIVANGRVTLSEAVQAIRSIPIIFVLVNDPVGQGFISSLARPVAMLPVLPSSSTQCLESRWNCSKRLRPESRASASSLILTCLLITTSFCLLSKPRHGSTRSS